MAAVENMITAYGFDLIPCQRFSRLDRFDFTRFSLDLVKRIIEYFELPIKPPLFRCMM